MTIYLDSYNEYIEWCEANGYDSDTEYDRGEESYKRDVNISCYIKKENTDLYASVSYSQSYDYGSNNFCIQEEGLIRKEEQVVVTKVKYIKE